VKRGILLWTVLTLAAAGCGGSSQERALQRLARAEADMEACKKQVGLEGTPTPENATVLDTQQKGKPLILDAERLAQMRLKVECVIPLAELLEARKVAGK
jgi:hypothetical protein